MPVDLAFSRCKPSLPYSKTCSHASFSLPAALPLIRTCQKIFATTTSAPSAKTAPPACVSSRSLQLVEETERAVRMSVAPEEPGVVKLPPHLLLAPDYATARVHPDPAGRAVDKG